MSLQRSSTSGYYNKMAASGRCSLFSRFLSSSKSWRVQALRQGCSIPLLARGAGTESGRMKLVQESTEEVSQGASRQNEVALYYCNRNPRSAELLGTADKPKGYATWNRRVDYYHRLMVDISSRHISAYVDHNNGSKVVEASTKEFSISRHLYKTSDVSAAFNVGRVIAARCKEAGLWRVMWEHKWNRKHNKVIAFIRGARLEGLILNEPKQRKKLPLPGSLPGY